MTTNLKQIVKFKASNISCAEHRLLCRVTDCWWTN